MREACSVDRLDLDTIMDGEGLSDGVVNEVSRGDEETPGVLVSSAVALPVSVTSGDGDTVALF